MNVPEGWTEVGVRTVGAEYRTLSAAILPNAGDLTIPSRSTLAILG